MQLLNGNVLTKEVKAEEKRTASGVILPGTAISKRPFKELLVEIDVINESTKEVLIPKGSTVYTPKHAGVEVELDNQDYIIINKRDIILSK